MLRINERYEFGHENLGPCPLLKSRDFNTKSAVRVLSLLKGVTGWRDPSSNCW